MKNDLMRATKERNTVAVSVLRSLLSAIDNAEAVPLTGEHLPTEGFGPETARRYLTEDDILRIITRERDERLATITIYERYGRESAASQLKREVELIASYAT